MFYGYDSKFVIFQLNWFCLWRKMSLQFLQNIALRRFTCYYYYCLILTVKAKNINTQSLVKDITCWSKLVQIRLFYHIICKYTFGSLTSACCRRSSSCYNAIPIMYGENIMLRRWRWSRKQWRWSVIFFFHASLLYIVHPVWRHGSDDECRVRLWRISSLDTLWIVRYSTCFVTFN